jgi:hypothetical protein
MKRTLKIFLAVVCGFACFACATEKQPAVKEKATPTPVSRADKKKFEDDLEYVRNGNFDYIFVLRRKDGNAFDGEDSTYIKANSPLETNQRLITDEGKTLIIGSNFRYTPEQIAALQKRFTFKDLSPAKDQPANSNSNAKQKNANRQADGIF